MSLIGELLDTKSDGKGKGGAFRALRTLRALRPLRAVSRWESMKVHGMSVQHGMDVQGARARNSSQFCIFQNFAYSKFNITQILKKVKLEKH